MDSYLQVLLGVQSVQLLLFVLSFFFPVFYRCGEEPGSKEYRMVKTIWFTLNICAFTALALSFLSAPAQRDFNFTFSLNLVSEISALGLGGAIIVVSLFNALLSILGLD